jgi:hypothetical protein
VEADVVATIQAPGYQTQTRRVGAAEFREQGGLLRADIAVTLVPDSLPPTAAQLAEPPR